jgi:ATPase subunit of ABC transporter with duplicated ATPase domains
MKERGSQTVGKKIKKLSKTQDTIAHQLTDNFVHKKIEPKFHLNAQLTSAGKSIASIVNGSCGYDRPILTNINMQLAGKSRIAIMGDNGSGKSTFIKTLLQDPKITINGQWQMPEKNNIGYLDQHYSNLNPDLTVQETIQAAAPDWDDLATRKHLNDFLFRSQKEVLNKVAHLSGGEKARLSLAQIAAQSPALLLLDEITNNIDLQTREHIIEVLSLYPGAMIIVSHDPDFLKNLSVMNYYKAENGTLNFVIN